jgi:hypothetical protein
MNWMDELQWDLKQSGTQYSPSHDERICFLLSYIIGFLDEPSKCGLPGSSERLLDIFERSIVTLSDRVKRYTSSTSVGALDKDRELGFYHEIDDLREELSMIKSVLLQQEEIWKQFVSQAFADRWKDNKLTPNANDDTSLWSHLTRPQAQLPKFFDRIDRLNQDARRVEETISIRLDLQAKHASIRQAEAKEVEAKAKDREAHMTAVMSTAVFGFTMVTIVFTPLSFLLALFALPIRNLQNQQVPLQRTNDSGATYVYTSNYVGKWVGKSSFSGPDQGYSLY